VRASDEERGVDALLEELGVLGPLVLDDELAVGVELLRDQRVERVAAAAPWQSIATISVAPAALRRGRPR
jgi:hypothetical protein